MKRKPQFKKLLRKGTDLEGLDLVRDRSPMRNAEGSAKRDEEHANDFSSTVVPPLNPEDEN